MPIRMVRTLDKPISLIESGNHKIKGNKAIEHCVIDQETGQQVAALFSHKKKTSDDVAMQLSRSEEPHWSAPCSAYGALVEGTPALSAAAHVAARRVHKLDSAR